MRRNRAYTITFGECAENHAGMQKLGRLAEEGLSYADLVRAKRRFAARGFECELVDLASRGRVEELDPEPATVLIVRGGAAALLAPGPGAPELQAELEGFEPDKKALMRGRVVNKNARHNLCFSEEPQEPSYEHGRGRVVAFAAAPLLAAARGKLPEFFGAKATALKAESNHYYDVAACGIGFHGDSERRIVIAVRLGAAFPLHYQWFHRGAPVGDRIKLELSHGDAYAMCGKAAGTDWRCSSFPTLRHAAGAPKYLKIAAK